MEVGHIVSLFPRKNGEVVFGVGWATYYLCKALAQRGHKVHIFAPYNEDIVEIEDNLIIHFYKSLEINIFGLAYKYFPYKLLLRSIEENVNISLVHVHNDTPFSIIIGLKYARKKGIPLVITWHGDWVENFGNVFRRTFVYLSNRLILDKLFSYASLIITPSIYYTKSSQFLRKYIDKVIEIPNGINPDIGNNIPVKEECRKKLSLPIEKDIVLFLSALFPQKGPHILLRAIPIIVKEIKDIAFIFIGKGNVEIYNKIAKNLQIEKYVRIIGEVKETEKWLYYNASDIFVFPSIGKFEVFPIVLLEASIFSLPIIASDLYTLKCIVRDGYNGLFFKQNDEKSLAEAVLYLLENESERRKMGKNARKVVISNYTWDRIAKKTEEVYEFVSQNRK